MEPLLRLLPVIGQHYLEGLLHPILWVFVGLIYFQYRRQGRMRERLFGIPAESAWGPTLQSLFYGVVGGLFGSLLMLLFGVTLSGAGLIYLLPVAIGLMLIQPRFICFAYAGGLLAGFSLLFGFPRLEIPQLMGLVAILHLVESSLIYLSGHKGAVPVYTRNRRGQVVGAFSLQKFWPVPVLALMVRAISDPGAVAGAGAITMPDWWPLLSPYGLEAENLLFVLLAIPAALGYGELAVTCRPEERTKRSAGQLAVYSLVLLLLSLIASWWPVAIWFPVLFAPLGHELIIMAGQKMELEGEPLYVQPRRGVMVLDVLPRSPASRLGLASGDIILSVNGIAVNNRFDLNYLLDISGDQMVLEYQQHQDGQYYCRTIRKHPGRPLGLILVPGEDDPVMVKVLTSGLLQRWWQRLRG